jgi:hypothetical protein
VSGRSSARHRGRRFLASAKSPAGGGKEPPCEPALFSDGQERRTLSDEERDDAKQVLALAIASIGRERAAADQIYVRGRNTVAFTATLFAAVQAALLSSIGRESAGRVLLEASVRSDAATAGAVAAGGLLMAVACLFFWLDRPRSIAAVGAETLTNAWLDPRGEYRDEAVIEVLVSKSIAEESQWARANASRRRAAKWLSRLCGLTAVAAVVELVFLYHGLT